ncbi:MAG TPA: hypothetical protein PLJ16_16950 [Casimicrobium huifangae]|uniref:hypothetical protein n=1 Tax=Casimicrobium huifangae TaxID=2591109 RepID=UPI0012EB1BE9|nr:hypothetical protein [Casimicrobium huifangae]HOB03542.1 hypothetical protein [Casimicrobium huifangae]HQD66918.1 hypothetical protein [Casimicrobium huifangae]
MRSEEAFVAGALVKYLGGPEVAVASDGPDPPDFYLTVGLSRSCVEVTRLSPFTFEPDGTLGNRLSQDTFGIRLINDLNESVGALVPDKFSLLVGLWVPVGNATQFRKLLTTWVKQVAVIAKRGLKRTRKLAGSKASVSVIPRRSSGNKIIGYVANTRSSADIGLNARLILEDRILRKSVICSPLPKPIWLALLNDYWLADAETYAIAAREIKVTHCFERIFLISQEGLVSELAVGECDGA